MRCGQEGYQVNSCRKEKLRETPKCRTERVYRAQCSADQSTVDNLVEWIRNWILSSDGKATILTTDTIVRESDSRNNFAYLCYYLRTQRLETKSLRREDYEKISTPTYLKIYSRHYPHKAINTTKDRRMAGVGRKIKKLAFTPIWIRKTTRHS